MNRKKDIINTIRSISGKYSEYEVFTDWIRCCAISISNSMDMLHGKVWQDRERTYLDTIRKYTDKEAEEFCKMCAMLAETFEDHMSDILGEIYMEAGMGSKVAGQFFTPYHLSLACAKMAINGYSPENGPYTINEPSCGGGGMIIAAAQTLKDKGINYQRCMRVVAQDLDWKGVYMCYVQLSLLGIHAICVQGNTLSEPYQKAYATEHVLYTPKAMGLLI